MAEELSYILVTPYTLAKSRTGGVLSRLLSRVDLELIAAQIIAPDQELVNAYAESMIAFNNPDKPNSGKILKDYVLKNFSPTDGRPHRTALFLFRGENACQKLRDVNGALLPENISLESLTGETIRDTYADLIMNPDGSVAYIEPAVLTPKTQEIALNNLRLFAEFVKNRPNIIDNVVHPDPKKIERTLVII